MSSQKQQQQKPQQTPEGKEKTKGSKTIGIINKLVALVGATVAVVFFSAIYNYQERQVKLYETKQDLIATFTEEAKLYALLKIGFMVAIFLIICTLSVMVIRIVTGRSNPIKFQDPAIIIALNRIIQNTIEQSFILLLNYAYFVYFASDQAKFYKGFVLASLFIKARYIFLFTYAVGALTGITSLRSVAFTLNVIIQITFLLENLGVPVINVHV